MFPSTSSSISRKHLLATVACVLAYAATSVSAHGYMSKPFCRGCERAAQDPTIAAPNAGGQLCRDNTIPIEINITAVHPGPCDVYLLDENLGNQTPIGHRDACVTANGINQWSVPVPNGASGKKVLRFLWKANNKGKMEEYEQCADIVVGNADGNAVAAQQGGFASATIPGAPPTAQRMAQPVAQPIAAPVERTGAKKCKNGAANAQSSAY
ncbi:hypothetical protein THASP1DRAFT_25691 [Thamnocephalis sphaerospora]|uniref:Uncharacterized protein n=1 Tax=Thamnocephalis sphaerospora TaxID=78915 RepID=A0A4P9XJF9_9FUNG|nr:hypothetical protein THASP1DRAFT_25691 [Thamnocephalis sphaerospora]|eukprot:RKP05893.1 hypothetical protein THASP1DRAFT_25691 [Thamnocephalis sphaerospora]